ncbi:ABC transporter permease [Blautia sp. Marseille-P3201T]|uniref:ABC transporter permease n=1 Tax=Blautia sp. Marseille-P3201T TaxID=1907659 RepID=UPI000A635E9E|nr:ABC transporter permease [Blautia sp. Marseille-P3201T]
MESVSEGNLNVGLNVTIPTKPGEKVTVFDQVFANMQSKFVALFLVIFAVLFSTADITSGYIKNIGGQVKERGNLILSKAIVLLIYTGLTLFLYLVIQAICQYAVFGASKWGDMEMFWRYFGTEAVLHYGLVLICMAVAIILKNNMLSMTLSVCLCVNVLTIVYSVVDKVLRDMGVKDFSFIEHTVSGKISLLSMTPKVSDCVNAIGIAGGFGLLAVLLTILVFRRRDI